VINAFVSRGSELICRLGASAELAGRTEGRGSWLSPRAGGSSICGGSRGGASGRSAAGGLTAGREATGQPVPVDACRTRSSRSQWRFLLTEGVIW